MGRHGCSGSWRRGTCRRWPRNGSDRLIELELSLPPDQASRLPRLRRLTPIKTSRTRNQPIRIVWHDTPGADLLRDGLAAAEQRGAWRLERVLPDGGPWPPGAPALVIAEAASPVLLDLPVLAAMMPVAAFEGRAIAVELRHRDEPVELRILDGTVRGVTAERRAARVQITGAAVAAVDLALDLADDMPLSVPRSALASEAIGVAQVAEPEPRRLGAPTMLAELSVPAAFAHITGHLTDVMLHWGARIAGGSDALEPVHQMRVAMRRLRSAVAQFPAADGAPMLDAARHGLKALAGVLGPARDWDVFCSETGQAVGEAFTPEAQIGKLLAAAERRRAEHYRTLRTHLDGAGYRKLMIRLAALSRPGSWEEAAGPERHDTLARSLPDFAADVLSKRLKGLLQEGETIDHLEPPVLHEIRLRGKRMRYAAELFGPLFPGKAPRRFIRRLTELQEVIGVLNDGAVAAQLMAELGGTGVERAFAVGVVRGFVAGRGAAHRREIALAWKRFRRTAAFWG